MTDYLARAKAERDEAQRYRDEYAAEAQQCLQRQDYGGFSLYADRAKQMEVLRRVIEWKIIEGEVT